MESFVLVSNESSLNGPSYPNIPAEYNGNGTKDANGPRTAVIRWLLENFQAQEDGTLPRGTVYSLYENFCTTHNLECFNAASFGKLIRSVFPDIKTRRLGTRGRSKYHYTGLAIKETSKLVNMSDIPRSPSPGSNKRVSRNVEMGKVIRLPPFEIPKDCELPAGVDVCSNNMRLFLRNYTDHCQTLATYILQFDTERLRAIMQNFYSTFHLSESLLCCEEFMELLQEYDEMMYQSVLYVLLPQVFGEPFTGHTAGRNFAFVWPSLVETYLLTTKHGFHQMKLQGARSFAHRLHQQCTLNGLVDTFRQILTTSGLLKQMTLDLKRTDLSFIGQKSDHVLGVHTAPLMDLLMGIVPYLEEAHDVGDWLHKFDQSIEEFMNLPFITGMTRGQATATLAGFLSVLMNDLTIRNAESFGSFQILRTFFEEYVQFFFDRQVDATLGRNEKPENVVIDDVQEEPPLKQSVPPNAYPQWNAGDSSLDPSSFGPLSYPARELITEHDPVMSNASNAPKDGAYSNYLQPETAVSGHMDVGNIPSGGSTDSNLYYFPQENIQRNLPYAYNGQFQPGEDNND